MPESEKRKKAVYTPPPTKREAVNLDSARWLAPVMVICFVIGLAWIVAFYLAGPSIPFMNAITVARAAWATSSTWPLDSRSSSPASCWQLAGVSCLSPALSTGWGELHGCNQNTGRASNSDVRHIVIPTRIPSTTRTPST